MAKTETLLTATEVERIKKPGRHAVGPSGLMLQISGANARSWIYRYQMNGKPHWAGLGSADSISLAEAASGAKRCARRSPTALIPLRPGTPQGYEACREGTCEAVPASRHRLHRQP
jgi:hypothetical protein